MQTAPDFRRLALGLAGATEGSHMGHPDFRAHGRIFASLSADGRRGMVKVSPDEQRELVARSPRAFEPENGSWGLQGCTRVSLDHVGEEELGEALTLAARQAARPPSRRRSPKRSEARRTQR